MIDRRTALQIESRMFGGKAILLMGPRQVGKTTLINHLLQRLDVSILRLNGDEPDVRELLADVTSDRLRKLIGQNRVIFIDEAQRIINIGLTLKLIVDQIPEVQVIATGSTALELAASINEPLTGRKFEFHLPALSFEELATESGMLGETRALPHRLVFGSYPEIVVHPGDEIDRLKLLADSYLYKDLLTLGELKRPQLLEKILRALALQLGNEVNYAEVSRLVGAAIGTVEKYIDLLTKAFIVFELPAFARNVRNEISRSRKIYFHDNGIRNAVLGNFQPIENRTDIGALWENYLVSERRKRWGNQAKAPSIHFWRTTARLPKTFSRAYPEAGFKVVTRQNYAEFLLPARSK